MFLNAVVACLVPLGATVAPHGPVELEAKVWWNSPSIRIPDDRTYVVLFFTTVQENKVVGLIPRLNRLDRRKDVVVVGLSPEREARVKSFIKRHQIRFAVGARSRAHKNKRFGVKSWPHLVVLHQATGDKQTVVPFADLSALESSLPPVDEARAPLVSGDFDENSPAQALRDHVLREPDYDARRRALRLLRTKMPPEEFMGFCDEIIDLDLGQDGKQVTWWGEVAYQKHLADPSVAVKQSVYSAYHKASREHRENPHDPRWAELEEYMATIEDRSAEELRDDFFAHLTDEPTDILIRRVIPDHIGKCGDKQAARRALMELLPLEPDFVIRAHIVGAFLDVCEVGDLETADFLEQHLTDEENIRHVRPFLRYTIRYLRTGEE